MSSQTAFGHGNMPRRLEPTKPDEFNRPPTVPCRIAPRVIVRSLPNPSVVSLWVIHAFGEFCAYSCASYPQKKEHQWESQVNMGLMVCEAELRYLNYDVMGQDPVEYYTDEDGAPDIDFTAIHPDKLLHRNTEPGTYYPEKQKP